MKRMLKQTTKLLFVTALVGASSALFVAGTAYRVQAHEVDRDRTPHRHAIRQDDERPPVPRDAVRPVPREEIPREAARPPAPREESRREESQSPRRPAVRRVRG